jgi:hypothetical protein
LDDPGSAVERRIFRKEWGIDEGRARQLLKLAHMTRNLPS